MHGKGIKLVLDDSKIASKPGENPNLYIIHDDDLLFLSFCSFKLCSQHKTEYGANQCN